MDSDFEKENERKRSKLEGEQPSSRLETLPRELILDIFSGLPVSSLVQLKSVCRAWRMLARDPDLVNMHSTRMAENNPCLILHSDYPIRNQLYFVELPAGNDKEEKVVKKFHVPFWAAMPEFDVVGSSNGLLCLSDSLYNDVLYVYNPFTRSYQELPKSTQYSNQEDVVLGFGFHPTTKEYKVVKIVYYRINADRSYPRSLRAANNMSSEVQIFTLGCSTWRSMGKLSYHLYQWPSQVLVNKRLHWVAWPRRYHPGRKIISFDLADEQFQEIRTPLKGCNYHLVVLGSCLSAAVYGNYGSFEIWVMTEYDVEESWIKKFNIGTYVPKGLEEDVKQSFKISKILWKGRFIRVLCLLKNGEILLEYKSRALASYDPKSGEFKDLMFQGIPRWYQTVVHVGSLNWTDTFIDA